MPRKLAGQALAVVRGQSQSSAQTRRCHAQRLASSPAACHLTPKVRSKGFSLSLRATEDPGSSGFLLCLQSSPVVSIGCTLNPPWGAFEKLDDQDRTQSNYISLWGRSGAGASIFLKHPNTSHPSFQPEGEFEKHGRQPSPSLSSQILLKASTLLFFLLFSFANSWV